MRISDWSSDVCSSDLTKHFDLEIAKRGVQCDGHGGRGPLRSEEHTSELQSLMRISYAVFCLKKQNNLNNEYVLTTHTQPITNTNSNRLNNHTDKLSHLRRSYRS